MIRQQWEKLANKMDGLALRERALIFLAVAFLLISLINLLFLDPLLSKQKNMSDQVVQTQEKTKEMQAQIQIMLQAKQDDAASPVRHRLSQMKQQLKEGDDYLKSRRDRLVSPDKMVDVLEQVLSKNTRLQLVNLNTLAVTPLIDKQLSQAMTDAVLGQPGSAESKQVFKHGVQITVRGSYADLLDYLTALEHLPTQMFWGSTEMKVESYPEVTLTLTLYTLSLDKIWLQI